MKKKIVALIALAIGIVAVFIIVCLNQKADTTDTVIGTMDKKAVEEKMIGAEPPRLLYADHDKAVFESIDIYVYDIKNKILLKAFDMSSLLQDQYKQCRYEYRVSLDGNEIFAGFEEFSGVFTAAFRYSFLSDKWMKMDENDYKSKRDNTFESTMIDADSELAQITSGYAVYLSESEYYYLTFENWKVSEINLVYVKDGKKTVYQVFDNMQK